MSRSYRHYKFRVPGKRYWKDFIDHEKASNRMARKQLCYELATCKTLDYFTTEHKRHIGRYDIYYAFCEYPKAYKGKFEAFDQIVNVNDVNDCYVDTVRADGAWKSKREIDFLIDSLPSSKRTEYIRFIHKMYKK